MATDIRGRRIAITRMQAQSGEIVERLEAEGFAPVVCPAIEIAPPADMGPLDDVIRRLAEFDVIVFTSANSVVALTDRMLSLGITVGRRPAVAAIGPATAKAARASGFAVTLVPSEFIAEELLREMHKLATGRALLLQGDLARPVLRDGLVRAGWYVEDIVAYRTLPGSGLKKLADLLRKQSIDAVTFSSASSVRYSIEAMKQSGTFELLRAAVIFCIGPVTARTAGELGLRVDAVAESYDAAGLASAIRGWFENHETHEKH